MNTFELFLFLLLLLIIGILVHDSYQKARDGQITGKDVRSNHLSAGDNDPVSSPDSTKEGSSEKKYGRSSESSSLSSSTGTSSSSSSNSSSSMLPSNNMDEQTRQLLELPIDANIPPVTLLKTRWSIAPDIAQALSTCIDYIIKDFISPWYIIKPSQGTGISNETVWLDYVRYHLTNIFGNFMYRIYGVNPLGLLFDDITEMVRIHLAWYTVISYRAAETEPEYFVNYTDEQLLARANSRRLTNDGKTNDFLSVMNAGLSSSSTSLSSSTASSASSVSSVVSPSLHTTVGNNPSPMTGNPNLSTPPATLSSTSSFSTFTMLPSTPTFTPADRILITEERRFIEEQRERCILRMYENTPEALHRACHIPSTAILEAKPSVTSSANPVDSSSSSNLLSPRLLNQYQYLRPIAAQLIQKLLPGNEKQALIQSILLKEIITTSIFQPLLASIDPDMLNMYILLGLHNISGVPITTVPVVTSSSTETGTITNNNTSIGTTIPSATIQDENETKSIITCTLPKYNTVTLTLQTSGNSVVDIPSVSSLPIYLTRRHFDDVKNVIINNNNASSLQDSGYRYFVGTISRGHAEECLKSLPVGSFLLRSKDNGTLILSYVRKGLSIGGNNDKLPSSNVDSISSLSLSTVIPTEVAHLRIPMEQHRYINHHGSFEKLSDYLRVYKDRIWLGFVLAAGKSNESSRKSTKSRKEYFLETLYSVHALPETNQLKDKDGIAICQAILDEILRIKPTFLSTPDSKQSGSSTRKLSLSSVSSSSSSLGLFSSLSPLLDKALKMQTQTTTVEDTSGNDTVTSGLSSTSSGDLFSFSLFGSTSKRSTTVSKSASTSRISEESKSVVKVDLVDEFGSDEEREADKLWSQDTDENGDEIDEDTVNDDESLVSSDDEITDKEKDTRITKNDIVDDDEDDEEEGTVDDDDEDEDEVEADEDQEIDRDEDVSLNPTINEIGTGSTIVATEPIVVQRNSTASTESFSPLLSPHLAATLQSTENSTILSGTVSSQEPEKFTLDTNENMDNSKDPSHTFAGIASKLRELSTATTSFTPASFPGLRAQQFPTLAQIGVYVKNGGTVSNAATVKPVKSVKSVPSFASVAKLVTASRLISNKASNKERTESSDSLSSLVSFTPRGSVSDGPSSILSSTGNGNTSSSLNLPSPDAFPLTGHVFRASVRMEEQSSSFDTKAVVRYVINMHFGNSRWSIRARYSEFHSLHNQLKDTLPDFQGKFPPKESFRLHGLYDSKFIEGRRVALDAWLQVILDTPLLLDSQEVRQFLGPKHVSTVTFEQYPLRSNLKPVASTTLPVLNENSVTLKDKKDQIIDSKNNTIEKTEALGTTMGDTENTSASVTKDNDLPNIQVSSVTSTDGTTKESPRTVLRKRVKFSETNNNSNKSEKRLSSKSKYDEASTFDRTRELSVRSNKQADYSSSNTDMTRTPINSRKTTSNNVSASAPSIRTQRTRYLTIPRTLTPTELQRAEIRSFALISEIFGLEGSGWVRRQVVGATRTLLRLLYHGSASKSVSLAYQNAISTKSLANQLHHLVHNVLWPNGKLRVSQPIRNWTEQRATRDESRALLLSTLSSTPLVALLGRDGLDNGVMKVHDFLQIPVLVDSLMYTFFDLLLIRLFRGVQVHGLPPSPPALPNSSSSSSLINGTTAEGIVDAVTGAVPAVITAGGQLARVVADASMAAIRTSVPAMTAAMAATFSAFGGSTSGISGTNSTSTSGTSETNSKSNSSNGTSSNSSSGSSTTTTNSNPIGLQRWSFA